MALAKGGCSISTDWGGLAEGLRYNCRAGCGQKMCEGCSISTDCVLRKAEGMVWARLHCAGVRGGSRLGAVKECVVFLA